MTKRKKAPSRAPSKTPARKPPAPKPPALQRVNLRGWLPISGIRPDKVSGFSLWVKSNGTTIATVPEWVALYQRYLSREVK